MRLDNITDRSHPLQNNKHKMPPDINNSAVRAQKETHGLHKEKVIKTSEVETVISKLNDFIEPLRTNLKFQLHEKLNEYYVAVVNPITKEVIKEIPPKKMLDMYAEMAELMGILIDQKI